MAIPTNELLGLLGYGPPPIPAPPVFAPPVPSAAAPELPPDAVSGPDVQEPVVQQTGLVDPFPAPYPDPAPLPNVGLGVSQSQAAFSPEKHTQVRKVTGGLRGQMANVAAESAARGQEDLTAAGRAASAEQQAAAAVGYAESQQIKAKAEGQAELQRVNDDFFRREQQASAEAKAAADEAKASYQAKLLEIPNVNPSQLWESAGNEGQFGMAVAAFLHDFLGAAGIKTSAMDTINGAIKRNIDGQLANIEKQKHVASGFKDLWEMTRAESATEAEARAKMQGFMLASVSAGIQAKMGEYDANLAGAKAQAAQAALQREATKAVFEVHRHIDAAANQSLSQALTLNGQELQAAQARSSNATQLKIAQLKAAGERGEAPPPVVYDQSQSGQGAAKWRIKPEYAKDKETVRDVSNKITSTTLAIKGFRELIDLQEKIGKAAPEALGRLRSEQTRLESAVRNRITNALILDQTGKAVNKTEIDRIMKLIPQHDWFTNGSNRAIISELLASKADEMQTTIGQFTDDIGPSDPAFGTKAASGQFAPGEKTEADILRTGAPETEATPVDKAVQKAVAPDSAAPERGASKSIKSDWETYQQARGGNLEATIKRRREAPGVGLLDVGAPEPDKAFVGVRELADLALKGDAQAESKLNELAGARGAIVEGAPSLSGGPGQPFETALEPQAQILKDYAQWELARINSRRAH